MQPQCTTLFPFKKHDLQQSVYNVTFKNVLLEKKKLPPKD